MAKKITPELLMKSSSQNDDYISPLADFTDSYLFGGNAAPIIIKDGDKLDININKLVEYKNQPFKMYSKDKLQDLADNIRENGIISPLTVRPIENTDTYQILAGHNRKAAALLAGLTKVPCIVRHVDDDTAKLILVDTNLNQREEILPSEKAFAYKLRLDAMKQKVGRKEKMVELSSTISEKSRETIDNNMSGRQVQKYIRLTNLIKPLLDKVDDKQIPINSGVEISYLAEDEQYLLNEYIGKTKLSINTAKDLRALSAQGEISAETIKIILCGKKKETITHSDKDSSDTTDFIADFLNGKTTISTLIKKARSNNVIVSVSDEKTDGGYKITINIAE